MTDYLSHSIVLANQFDIGKNSCCQKVMVCIVIPFYIHVRYMHAKASIQLPIQ